MTATYTFDPQWHQLGRLHADSADMTPELVLIWVAGQLESGDITLNEAANVVVGWRNEHVTRGDVR